MHSFLDTALFKNIEDTAIVARTGSSFTGLSNATFKSNEVGQNSILILLSSSQPSSNDSLHCVTSPRPQSGKLLSIKLENNACAESIFMEPLMRPALRCRSSEEVGPRSEVIRDLIRRQPQTTRGYRWERQRAFCTAGLSRWVHFVLVETCFVPSQQMTVYLILTQYILLRKHSIAMIWILFFSKGIECCFSRS